jgi:predicted dehydrogenase
MIDQNLKRRTFLKAAGGAGAVMSLPALNVLGANEKVRVGFIGLGGRGKGSVNWFNKLDDVEIAGFCDPDEGRANQFKDKFPNAMTTTDMRKLIDSKDIDAVVISTCNHWHALATMWACEAGKDVYVEKPVSYTIDEGRAMVASARKYNRIVQGGTQQRSDTFHAEVKAYMDSGELGKIKYVRCNRYGTRAGIGKRDTPLTPPANVDYNLWLGPAEDQKLYRDQLHYDWHWDFNTGNGELGNWGPHIMDDMRNLAFRDKYPWPTKVIAGGGRLAWNDAGNTPNTHFVYLDTPEVPVIFDVHNLPRQKGMKAGDFYKRRRTGAFLIIECENGYYAGGRGGGAVYDLEGNQLKKWSGTGGGGHAANFIAAVKSRKPSDLNAEIEQIHYSSAWCHLGNLSWRLGAKYSREEAEAAVKGYEPWNDVIADFHEHTLANEINLAEEDVRLGQVLTLDPKTGDLTGDSATKEAKALYTREYRKGFELPKV